MRLSYPTGSVLKKVSLALIDMLHGKTDIDICIFIGEISIVHTNLHIKIIDIGLVDNYRSGHFGIEELSVKLIRKFQVGIINALVHPSGIESDGKQTGISQHLMIGDRSIHLGGGQTAGTGHVMQDGPAQTQASRTGSDSCNTWASPQILMVLYGWDITEDH